MWSKHLVRLVGLAFVFGLGAFVMAQPVPSVNLPILEYDSDVVVVGEVTSIRDEGPETIDFNGQPILAYRKLAELQILRVLKGTLVIRRINISYYETTISLGYARITVKQFGMWFLKYTKMNTIILTSPYYPFLVCLHDSPIGGKGIDAIVQEVARVLEVPEASADEIISAIRALDTVDSPRATRGLKRAANAVNTKVRIYAVGALLRRNDISQLSVAVSVLLQSHPDIDQFSLTWVTNALERITRPEAIPTLAQLLSARDPQVRRSATAAIANTRDPKAIDLLASVLDDDDKLTRYHAVVGLAWITGQGEWGPAIYTYEKDEERYLSFWRKWAKERKL